MFQSLLFHHCCSITAAPAFSVPPVFSVPVLLTIVHHCCSPLIKGPSIIQELCVHTLQLWLWIVATIVLGLDEYRDIIMAISLGSAAFVMFAPLFTAWCPQHYKDQASACFLIWCIACILAASLLVSRWFCTCFHYSVCSRHRSSMPWIFMSVAPCVIAPTGFALH